jgi:hypothetical protein
MPCCTAPSDAAPTTKPPRRAARRHKRAPVHELRTFHQPRWPPEADAECACQGRATQTSEVAPASPRSAKASQGATSRARPAQASREPALQRARRGSSSAYTPNARRKCALPCPASPRLTPRRPRKAAPSRTAPRQPSPARPRQAQASRESAHRRARRGSRCAHTKRSREACTPPPRAARRRADPRTAEPSHRHTPGRAAPERSRADLQNPTRRAREGVQ